MAISKYNPEGYFDPTSHEALTNIEAERQAARLAKVARSPNYRPIVFICSPYADDPGATSAAPCDTADSLCAGGAFPSRRTSISRGFWMKPIRRTVNWGCLWAECC